MNNVKAPMGQNQVPVDINETDAVVCKGEGCGCEIFEQAALLRRLSPLNPRSGGQEQIIPVPVMLCKACGKILE